MKFTIFPFVFTVLGALIFGIAYASEGESIPEDNCSPPVTWEKDPQYDIVRCANSEYIVDPDTGEKVAGTGNDNSKACIGPQIEGSDIETCVDVGQPS